MKIAVLGNTGMLGHVVQETFSKDLSLRVNGYGRESLELAPRTLNQIGTKLSSLLGFNTDYVINCMGATKPYFDSCTDLTVPLYTNAIFPHQLAKWGELSNTKIIHITTDCVYDGILGRYDERAPSSATDLYGKSKSIGEPINCMVVRTSIIGPEQNYNSRHFLSWVKSLHGKSANGFTNHYWNGLTTIELARVLLDIVLGDFYMHGTQHIYSTDMSKCEMVEYIADIYGLDIDLSKKKTDIPCDRRLRTINSLNWQVSPKPFAEMIKDMFWYEVDKMSKEAF